MDPLLFLIYVNDISKLRLTSDILLYADHTVHVLTCYAKGRRQNSPLRATNCIREMLVSCFSGFCSFCGMSQKAITTICE